MGMGYLGLGKKELAHKFLSEVMRLDINHQAGKQLLEMCESIPSSSSDTL